MSNFFTNPIIESGADPFVTKFAGKYYYCYSVGDGVNVSVADKLYEVAPAKDGRAVYRAPKGCEYSCEYWAPELHRIDGRWYIYVAADDGDNINHRMYALGALTDDPCGPYEMLGKIAVDPPYDKWAIDATVLTIDRQNYFVWSGWSGDFDLQQNLYIAKMKDGKTLEGKRSLISCPELDWEMRSCGHGAPTINEGPAALYHDGKTFIVYSGSGSWSDDYCLGLLEFKGGDPLDPLSWEKHTEPILTASEGAWGPGHCSFTTSPDGSEDYVVYHANRVSGTSWGGRSVRIQKIDWVDGLPVIGSPTKPGVELPVPSENAPKIDTIIFDLDGTLVPIDQHEFTSEYLRLLGERMAVFGFEPKQAIDTIWKGCFVMTDNDGSVINSEAFYRSTRDVYGDRTEEFLRILTEFYETDFDKARSTVKTELIENGSFNAAPIVRVLKEKGYTLALATNPVFPLKALEVRLSWVGLTPDDFTLITNYENSRFCKPNPRYFEDIILALGKSADSCLMIGNNLAEDMSASKVGIACLLLTDFLENRKGDDVDAFEHCRLAELPQKLGL